MKIDLDELEGKARAAAGPLPWRVYRCRSAGVDEACGVKAAPFVSADDDSGYHGVVYDTAYDECHHHMVAADAEHIAANSPPVTLALIARIRELEAGLADTGEALRMLADYYEPPVPLHRGRLQKQMALLEKGVVVE